MWLWLKEGLCGNGHLLTPYLSLPLVDGPSVVFPPPPPPPTETCSSSLVDSDSPSYTIITHVLGFTLLHNLQTHTHVGCTCSFIRYGPVTKDTELIFTSGLFCAVEGKRVTWKFVLGWLRHFVFISFQHFLLWQSEAEQIGLGTETQTFPGLWPE